MSRFNVRAIGAVVVPPPPPPPAGKLSSAYHAMKHPHEVIAHVEAPVKEEKKRGRPSKEEIRKHKLSMSDGVIHTLVEDKPTLNKIRDYMEARIMELDKEKR